ncbi:MAG: Gfo/Idh/MocA family protein [Lachnospirales bacterium]
MKKVKVGIIGCGGIANGKHLPALKEIKEVELVAFCDIIEERAVKACKEYGVEGAKHYKDYKELLKDKNIETIHVCTPNKSHSFITIDALRSDKHVLCEKPMAKTYAEAKEMVEVAKETGKILTIGYQYRYRPHSLHMKNVCERGDLGDIYFAKAHAIRRRAVPTWGVFLNEEEQGGGPLIDIGTHALDSTLWYLNKYKPVSVKGSVYKKLSENGDCGNSFGPWDPNEFTVEDSAFGFITMEDGTTIILESSWALNTLEVGEAQATLCGTKGGADTRNETFTYNGDDFGRLVTSTADFSKGGVAFFEGGSAKPEVIEARIFYDAVLYGKDLCVKPEQALVVTQILEAIYKSSETGEEIKL